MVKTINFKQNNKSVHYLKDLAYLQLALGFFYDSLDDMMKNTPTDENLIKANIDLIKEIQNILDLKDFYFGNLNSVDIKKKNELATKLLKSFVKIGGKANTSLNLELIAIYVLYTRFSDGRKKYLHENFNKFSNNEYLFNIARLICKLDKEDEGVEYFITYELAKVL